MKKLPRWLSSVRRRSDSAWQMMVGHGFQITGLSIFIAAFRWRRDILLSTEELESIAAAIRARPGPMLVFGAGNDSILWSLLNRGLPTLILESEPYWVRLIGRRWRSLKLQPVVYTTRLSDLSPKDAPTPPLALPEEVRRQAWEIILVDAPLGWGEGPGRSQSIFEASRLVAEGGRIFVHDCDRMEEQKLIEQYLGRFECQKVTERLWMFH